MKYYLLFFTILLNTLLNTQLSYAASPSTKHQWFETIKKAAKNDGKTTDLYRVLYYMPKGGDLHNHLSGAGFSQWWYELALEAEERGYIYYTKIKLTECFETPESIISSKSYQLLYRNISANEYKTLDDCVKEQYKELKDLNLEEKTAWLNSIRLDEATEGREEFFQRHWQRLHAINDNPWLKSEILFKNMQAFSEENLVYVEFQLSLDDFERPDGSFFTEQETAIIFRNRLIRKDALDTGVVVRFQMDFLRFSSHAIEDLKSGYKFVHDNQDLWVGMNMVGDESHKNGHPLRFLKVMGEMKKKYGPIKLSIHAGESEEKNFNVRDTLLLGAERIGHGLNLIHDISTMNQMRINSYLIEINLISNLLLKYVKDYKQHPFLKYLREGIPVALSTDDRGMWDSTMTDEFFVAVIEFDLSWEEIKLLSRNSLKHSFLDDNLKNKLLNTYENKMTAYESHLEKTGLSAIGKLPATRSFICKYYEICQN